MGQNMNIGNCELIGIGANVLTQWLGFHNTQSNAQAALSRTQLDDYIACQSLGQMNLIAYAAYADAERRKTLDARFANFCERLNSVLARREARRKRS